MMDSGEDGGRSFVTVPPLEGPQRAALLKALVDKGAPVEEFRLQAYSLEEIFMRLTLEQEVDSGDSGVGEVDIGGKEVPA
jgi:hypothetical protein